MGYGMVQLSSESIKLKTYKRNVVGHRQMQPEGDQRNEGRMTVKLE